MSENSNDSKKSSGGNKRVIQYNIQNTRGVSSPLIPFNCIFDLDVGLLRLISMKYANPDVFDREFFAQHPDNISITHAAYVRKKQNPLFLCLKDKSDEQTANELYSQFMKEKYIDICLNCVYTGIYTMVRYFAVADDITATLVYHNDIEKYILEQFKFKNVALADIRDVKAGKVRFNQCIFKTQLNDLYLRNLIDRVARKMVYIMDYRYNFTEEELGLTITDDLLSIKAQLNQLSIISAYDEEIANYGEENNDDGNNDE